MDMLDRANEYIRENRIAGALRPLFHVTPPVGWMNDPNGFSEYNGEVHLFYQFHPYSTQWGPMHWGHVKSSDMVRWEELPVALAPDKEYDCDGCFSGSALERDGRHILVYTGVRGGLQNQCIAVGDGESYSKTPDNPVITGTMLPDGFSQTDFRDPKIFCTDDGYGLIAVNCDENNRGQIVRFVSRDLKDWKYDGVVLQNDGSLGCMWECPDCFSIDGHTVLIFSPQDVAATDTELHNGDNSVYKVDPDGKFCEIDYGLDFYAPQTTRLGDGRQVLIGWLHSWKNDYAPAGAGLNGMMTIPRELTLIGDCLYQNPVKELSNYYEDSVEYEHYMIKGMTAIPGISGRTADMTVEFPSDEDFMIRVAADEKYHTDIRYDSSGKNIFFDRRHSGITKDINCVREFPLHGVQQTVRIRIILDRNSVELFVNGGREAFSAAVFTAQSADGIYFLSDKMIGISVEYHRICI